MWSALSKICEVTLSYDHLVQREEQENQRGRVQRGCLTGREVLSLDMKKNISCEDNVEENMKLDNCKPVRSRTQETTSRKHDGKDIKWVSSDKEGKRFCKLEVK
jgi:hypothetical protein